MSDSNTQRATHIAASQRSQRHGSGSLRSSAGSDAPAETTERLLDEAIRAVNKLSVHLEQLPDKPRMYLANQAYWKLWQIE